MARSRAIEAVVSRLIAKTMSNPPSAANVTSRWRNAVVAQWVHVAQSPVGIPWAQGHLQQSRQRHRKRARFVEGQNNLALLAVLVLEGEAYRASVARDSAITFMHLPLPSIAVTRRLAKSLSY